MRPLGKRVLAGVVAASLAAIAAPLLGAAPAFATGSLQGPASIMTAGGGAALQSGDGATNWTLRLPSGASCPGDSANSNWHWDTYMVPSSVNPNSLQFGSTGPTPSGTGASFSQPLYDTNGNPVVNEQTANQTTANGPGAIINIPDVNFQVFTPGQIPAGVYNLGIACILGPASSTQESNFWNVQMTVATGTAANGNAQITWQNGTVPNTPSITGVTPGDGRLTVAFNEPAGSNPAVTGFTATATGPGGPFTASGAGSPLTITGLTNLSSYSVTVHATNSVGNSPESGAQNGTPGKPAVTGLAATPAPNQVTLNWNAPSPAPASYTVDYCTGDATASGNGVCDSGDGTFVGTTSPATNSATIAGTPGQLYTYTVYYPQSFKSSITATPQSSSLVIQDVSVVRPAGALVLTQVCGQFGNVNAETAATATPGFQQYPANTPAGNASGNTPTGPTYNGSTDPNYTNGQYPSPASPNYPTHCSLDLGTASMVTTGPRKGQFFAAAGRLNQVTVSDARDTDTGWTLNAVMSSFSGSSGGTLSGNQLGWTGTTDTHSASFTDGNGNPYSQAVIDDADVQPDSQGAAGMGTAHTMAETNAGSGLGIATIDSRIKVLIPIAARAGTYTGTLTISLLNK